MKKRRPKLGDLMILIALSALELAGIAYLARPRGPAIRFYVWPPTAGENLVSPAIFFGPFVVLTGVIFLYVPPKLDEYLWAALVLLYLVGLLLPVIHS